MRFLLSNLVSPRSPDHFRQNDPLLGRALMVAKAGMQFLDRVV
jgi:hypothetical protein